MPKDLKTPVKLFVYSFYFWLFSFFLAIVACYLEVRAEETTPLDKVPLVETTPLDNVPLATTVPLSKVDTGEMVSLEDVSSGATTPLYRVPLVETTPLSSIPLAKTISLDEATLSLEERNRVQGGVVPVSAGPETYAAQEVFIKAAMRLNTANKVYSNMMYHNYPLGLKKVEIIKERDLALESYTRAAENFQRLGGQLPSK